MNYSFWADEAYVSSIAIQWLTGKLSFINALNMPGITYQKLYVLVLATFFKLFGINEFTARLPSMIVFLIGTITIFFLARKLSNVYGGILSTFIYAFSHLNLAYATQAKPYGALETILLIVLFLMTQKKVNHFLIILLCTIATLLHSIGVLIWVAYFVYSVLTWKRWNVGTFLTLAIVVIVGYIFILPIVLSSIGGEKLLPYNHFYQVIKLFAYKYSFISMSAFFGFIWSFKKNKNINLTVLIYSAVVFFMATFRAYIFNIRYVLPLFGIIFLYFGIFWTKIGEKYLPKKPWIIPLVVILLIYATGYKVVRFPQTYYNPNIDKYGDVQIANYKDFYFQLKKRFLDYKDLYVVNDTFDVEYWYFGRYSNAYFMKFTTKP